MGIAAAVGGLLIVIVGATVALTKAAAARKRDGLIEDGEQHAAKLKVDIAVEEDRASRRPEQDAADDASDMAAAADVAAVVSKAEPPHQVNEDGVRGGMMPASTHDEELYL